MIQKRFLILYNLKKKIILEVNYSRSITILNSEQLTPKNSKTIQQKFRQSDLATNKI